MDNNRGVLKASIDDNADLELTGKTREVRVGPCECIFTILHNFVLLIVHNP